MKLIYLIAMCVVLSTISCKTKEIDNPIIIGNIEEEIILELFEELALPDRGLLFRMETKAAEDCLNATISTRFTRQPSRMELDILEIEEPGECEPGSAPARGIESAGIVANANYEFSVTIRNLVESVGLLEVNSDMIRVSFDNDPQGFIVEETELLRIPQNVVWGYVLGIGDTPEAMIEELSNLGSVWTNIPVGYYGYFRVNGSDDYQILEDTPILPYQPFLFLYAGSDQQISGKIEELRANYPDNEIYFRNARGDSF